MFEHILGHTVSHVAAAVNNYINMEHPYFLALSTMLTLAPLSSNNLTTSSKAPCIAINKGVLPSWPKKIHKKEFFSQMGNSKI